MKDEVVLGYQQLVKSMVVGLGIEHLGIVDWAFQHLSIVDWALSKESVNKSISVFTTFPM